MYSLTPRINGLCLTLWRLIVTIQKTENHITDLPRNIDPHLSIALGEMVVAYGRLEDMFKIVIKRIEGNQSLEDVIRTFSGMDGTIGRLASYCEKFPTLSVFCANAKTLNASRQDFIHATFAADDTGQYVRFRQLVGYTDLNRDITEIKRITEDVNSLIQTLDSITGAALAAQNNPAILATVSAAGSIQK
jgi:hypothetical protein